MKCWAALGQLLLDSTEGERCTIICEGITEGSHFQWLIKTSSLSVWEILNQAVLYLCLITNQGSSIKIKIHSDPIWQMPQRSWTWERNFLTFANILLGVLLIFFWTANSRASCSFLHSTEKQIVKQRLSLTLMAAAPGHRGKTLLNWSCKQPY